jgi:hypothetical protein
MASRKPGNSHGSELISSSNFSSKSSKILATNRSCRRGPLVLEAAQDVLDQQVAVSDVQAVPEIFTPTDVLRVDASLISLAVTFGLDEGVEQHVEQVGNHHEQRIRQMRKAGLLPLLHRAEEIGVAGQPHDPQIPVVELAAQTLGNLADEPSPATRAEGDAAGGEVSVVSSRRASEAFDSDCLAWASSAMLSRLAMIWSYTESNSNRFSHSVRKSRRRSSAAARRARSDR